MNRITISDNEMNQRLDRFLRKYLKDTALTDIYRMIRKKEVRVNGRGAKENYRLIKGDIIDIPGTFRGEETPVKPAERDFSIAYEDENILAIDKPPGLILHPDSLHRDNTLVDQVLYYLFEKGSYIPENEKTFKPSAVNRLDLNTGGLVLFAKNYESLKNLSYMVRERLVEKYYLCIVKGNITEGCDIKAFISKDYDTNIAEISYRYTENSKPIQTKIMPVKNIEGYTLLEIELVTGRSHQIRAQLSSMGYPIIGDIKYGDRKENKRFKEEYNLNFQFLYAYEMVFKETLDNLDYMRGRVLKSHIPDNYRNMIKQMFGLDME